MACVSKSAFLVMGPIYSICTDKLDSSTRNHLFLYQWCIFYTKNIFNNLIIYSKKKRNFPRKKRLKKTERTKFRRKSFSAQCTEYIIIIQAKFSSVTNINVCRIYLRIKKQTSYSLDMLMITDFKNKSETNL